MPFRKILSILFIDFLKIVKFDRNADGWFNHIERDHCLWNYLYFIFHIQHKDTTEYNGIESYVANKVIQIKK